MKRILIVFATLALATCLLTDYKDDKNDSSNAEAAKEPAPQETVLPTLSEGEVPVIPD